MVFGLGWDEHPPEKAQLCVNIPTMYTAPDGAPQSRKLRKMEGLGIENRAEEGAVKGSPPHSKAREDPSRICFGRSRQPCLGSPSLPTKIEPC